MNGISVFFLDKDLGTLAVCDAPVSLEYSELFCGAGAVRCVVPPSSPAAQAALPDGFLRCGGALYTVDSIEKVSESGQLTVRGSGVLSLFSRRAVPRDFAFSLSPEGCVRRLAETYAPELPADLEISVDAESSERSIVIAPGDLLERITSLAASVSKGLSLTYDGARERFVLSIGAGTDRRPRNADGNEPLILSESFGSVRGVRSAVDRSRYVNRVTVLGASNAPEDAQSVTVDAADLGFSDGIDDSAEALREAVVRSGISASLYTYNSGGVSSFDRAGYLAALRERGREELALRRAVRTLSAQLVGGAARDAKVGDICSVSCGEPDVRSARIAAITSSFKGGRLRVTAELTAL